MCEYQTWHYAFQHAYLNIQSMNFSPQTLFCMWRLVFWESQLFIFQYRWPVSSEHLELKLSQKNSAHHIFMGILHIFIDLAEEFFWFLQSCLLWFLLSVSESHFFPFDGEMFHGGNGNVFESQMFMEIACFYNNHTASLLLFLKLPWDFYTLIQLRFIVFWNQH